MLDFLVNHAIENVWCNPDQDNQLIFSANRLTTLNGELNRFKLVNRQVTLPTNGVRYHVYNIGQISPSLLGLLEIDFSLVTEQWERFTDTINNSKTLVSLYSAKGVQIPRFTSYYMYTAERALIFAVELDSNIPIDYNNEQIYLRLYDNAFYQSSRANAVNDFLKSNGQKILNTANILSLQSEVTTLAALPGFLNLFVNGITVNAINPLTVKVGDSVEYVYDSSVKKVVTYDLSSLPSFASIQDNKIKYLLHNPISSNDTIDYQDDIDVYLITQSSTGSYQGVYYPRNSLDSHRMVTHHDYSIVADYVNYLLTSLNGLIVGGVIPSNTYKLQVIVRNSGYYRPLVQDNNRIFELYKLSSDKQLQAMVGVNSTVPEWKAENLEASAYVALMSSQRNAITIQEVQDAYGYNAISKLVADTPTPIRYYNSKPVIDIGVGLQANSTMYEYDINGSLLEWHLTAQSDVYICANDNTKLVEGISGVGTDQPDTVFGTDDIILPSYDNYRVYMCYIDSGIPNDKWIDITGTNNYTVINGVLKWANLVTNQFLMVRTDATFLAYDLDITPVNGNIFFTLMSLEDRGSGYVNTALSIPYGEMDIYLNGKALIENLDYKVQFPVIYILNTKYLNTPKLTNTQHLHIRCTGFCDSNLKSLPADDFGFIKHGLLSNNNKFDIQDDKVLRITVDGSVKHRSSIVFAEDHSGISITDPINGLPYQITDIVVPLKQLVNDNTYTLRSKSLAIDKRVSDYLSTFLPQADTLGVNAIPSLYPIISPFFSRIYYSLIHGVIDNKTLASIKSDNDVLTTCKQFEYLLAFDPTNPDNEVDSNYVTIIPHTNETPINLTLVQYRFLTNVVRLYGQGLIDISTVTTFSN